MAKRPMAVRIVRDRTEETIMVYLPCRGDFPYNRRFALLRNVVDVEVTNTDDKFSFELTLHTNNKPACREQLNRLFPVSVISRIINGTEADCTIEIGPQSAVAALAALRQIAKFSQRRAPLAAATSVSIVPGAVGPAVTKQRDAQEVLLSLADKSGRISAGSLPQPHPAQAIITD